MRFEIILAPSAIQELQALAAHVRSAVSDGIELHLRFEPQKVSKSRIKRLQGLDRPQYRLRVDEIRVFSDVTEAAVEVLAIVSKAEAAKWLKEKGTPSTESGSRKGEG